MTARTILIPPFFYPDGMTPARARIHVELVDEAGEAIIGFAPDYGIARRLAVDTDESDTVPVLHAWNPALLELEPNADIYPDSQWRFTIVAGNIQTSTMVVLEEGAPIDLRDLLYGDST